MMDSRISCLPVPQAALLKEKFQTALQNYQQVEQRQRNATKNQMERQYRIGKVISLSFDKPLICNSSEARCLS